MLTVLLAWILIFFIFITFGDILLTTYNKVCNTNERYSLLNLFLLGIPSLLLVLSTLHFFVPISSYVLFGLCFFAVGYWLANLSDFKILTNSFIEVLCRFSKVEVFLLVAFVCSILFITSWGVLNYDSACYHYQSLRWIEEYPTVVGLGNIEERLGFNSNYFILSAPFSMRFLLKEPLFALQGLLVVLMFAWILYEMVKSNYSFKIVFLLLLHIIIIAINFMHFSDSSTDVIPNQLVFYLVAYLVLYPEKIKKDNLLLGVLPIVILTFKLSLGVFALISLVVIVSLINKKNYKSFYFISALSLVIGVLWLVRNVILSGYLIFPMYELDFFSVDWKVSRDVAFAERGFIKSGAVWQFKNLYNNALTFFSAPKWYLFHTYVIAASYIIIALSIPYLAFLSLKGRINNTTIIIYIITLLGVVASYLSAPDFRFSYGLVFGVLFISMSQLLDNVSFSLSFTIRKIVASVGVIFLLIHLISTFWQLSTDEKGDWSLIVLKPREYSQKKISNQPIEHREIGINNNIKLYISNSSSGFTMYKLPAVPDDINKPLGWRFQSYVDLEARGTTLKDGFRTRNTK